MSKLTWAIRGATTVERDTQEQVSERSVELVREMLNRNAIDEADVVSVLFTATEDICSAFPATPVRLATLSETPLICAREIPVPGSLPLCIRVLLHVNTDKRKDQMVHIYLHAATKLRGSDD